MRFVVVTGMSGGGKRTALKLLEDAGFYCVAGISGGEGRGTDCHAGQ